MIAELGHLLAFKHVASIHLLAVYDVRWNQALAKFQIPHAFQLSWQSQQVLLSLKNRTIVRRQSSLPLWKPQNMMEFVSTESLVALFTLTFLEVVLGIDNVIFIAILAGKLPESQRDYARKMGLTLAVVSRAILVLAIGFVMQLNLPLFSTFGTSISGKDIILILGGLFLLGKATYEIHRKIEHANDPDSAALRVTTMKAVLTQVLFVDVVFSLDSVITAVGMTEGLKYPIPIMIAAIVISVVVMLLFSKAIVTFIERHPAIKILALAFLLLIGTLLVAEGFHQKIPKGYVYFAMAFSLGVELLQMHATRQITRENPKSS